MNEEQREKQIAELSNAIVRMEATLEATLIPMSRHMEQMSETLRVVALTEERTKDNTRSINELFKRMRDTEQGSKDTCFSNTTSSRKYITSSVDNLDKKMFNRLKWVAGICLGASYLAYFVNHEHISKIEDHVYDNSNKSYHNEKVLKGDTHDY